MCVKKRQCVCVCEEAVYVHTCVEERRVYTHIAHAHYIHIHASFNY